MKKGLYLFLLFLLACSKKEKGETLLALDWTFNTNHIGILAGIKKGYYEQEGISLKLIELGKNGVLPLLMGEEVDLALSSQGEFSLALKEGYPLLSIATLFQHNPSGFYSLKQKGLFHPSQLVGKKYGGWGSAMEETFIKAIMRQDKIKDPYFTSILIGSMNIRSVLSHVDFIWGYESWQGVELSLNRIPYFYIPVSRYIKELDDYSPILLLKKGSKISLDEKKLQAFLRASKKGYEWVTKNPLEATSILLEYDPTLSSEMLKESLLKMVPFILNPSKQWGIQEEKRYAAYFTFLQKEKILTADISVPEIMTNRFLDL